MLKDSRFFHFFFASRKRAVLLFAGILAVAALLVCIFQRVVSGSGKPPVEDAPKVDTLALNIICTPTLDCLPFYHAVESGICDSMGLALCIRTEMSQFDVDSILCTASYIDGAVLDDERLARYRSVVGKVHAGVRKTTRNAGKVAQKTKGRKGRGQKPVADAAPVPWWTAFPALTEAIRLESTWRLVTSSALRIREVPKLRKRTVAVSRFSASSECLAQALARAGLKEGDVYRAQVNNLRLRQEMLDENQVDAAVLPEPYATVAVLRGHRLIWSADTASRSALCLRSVALKNPRKCRQLELLKQVYRKASDDLNRRGVHAADSALVKGYGLSPEVIDTLRLPNYR